MSRLRIYKVGSETVIDFLKKETILMARNIHQNEAHTDFSLYRRLQESSTGNPEKFIHLVIEFAETILLP